MLTSDRDLLDDVSGDPGDLPGDLTRDGSRELTRDATMRDVAQRAGVSIKTVSRVINNQGEISEATRQHVLSVIQELDYRPNSLARGLVSGKTLSVALIISQISDPFFPEMVHGVESVARQHGYSVFLCNTNEDPQQELDSIDVLSRKQVDGIILCGTRLTDEQMSDVAARHPVAILTSRSPAHTSVVQIPSVAGLARATSHLIQLGHKKIAHVGIQPQGGELRQLGYRQAMADHGLAINPEHILLLPQVTIDMARAETFTFLQRTPEVTAVSCYNDLVAIGVLQAAKDTGRRVPEDLAIVGFDDLPISSLVTPKLTSMHVPRYEVGQMVMELLMRVMSANGQHEERLPVPLKLVIRESCGGAAKNAALVSEKR